VALGLRESGVATCIVKPVQTGLLAGETGDADRAGALAGCEAYEYVRFSAPADPWSAALAEQREAPSVRDLAARIAAETAFAVIEGAGGAAVPLNQSETFADLAAEARLGTIVVVGLRLGCINHALLSIAYLQQRKVEVLGCVLVDRWSASDATYRADVARALEARVPLLGYAPRDDDEPRSVQQLAAALREVVR